MAKQRYFYFKGVKTPISKPKKLTNKTEIQLFNELVRKTGQVNKRLRSIKNEYGSISWAGSKLKSKTEIPLLDVWRGNRIKVNKNMSVKQMKATIKAMDEFLKSKTSTVKGIKQTKQKTINTFKETLSMEDIELSTKDAESLYNLFGNKDYNLITNYIDASEFNALLDDAKTMDDSKNQFIDRISNYILVGQDEDLINSLSNIYDKYVAS